MFIHNPGVPSTPLLPGLGALPLSPTGPESKIVPTTTEMKVDPELARLKLERMGIYLGLATLMLTAYSLVKKGRK